MMNVSRRSMMAGIAAPGEAVGVFEELNSVYRYQRVADMLGKRGWSWTCVEKRIGGNFLRVFREAWGA